MKSTKQHFASAPLDQSPGTKIDRLLRIALGLTLLLVLTIRAAPAFSQTGAQDHNVAPVPGASLQEPALADKALPVRASRPAASEGLGSPTWQRVAGMTRLSSVLDRVGRAADVSEQGGACGGIMVHDWIAENLRVVSLGDSVQAVSPIPDGAH